MTDLDANLQLKVRALEFARSELGPASERLLAADSAWGHVEERMSEGLGLEDAVLATLHRSLGGDRRVADEFAAYFLYDLMRMGKLSMASSSHLRRFLDTGDLVLSVFGDLWGDLASLRFESARQFKTLFARRMTWKAADQARRMNSGNRREDKRVAGQPEELAGSASPVESGLNSSIRQEERDRLILILLRLGERDRQVLTLHLKGLTVGAIAEELGSSYDAARKALDRAVKRARSLADGSESRAATTARGSS